MPRGTPVNDALAFLDTCTKRHPAMLPWSSRGRDTFTSEAGDAMYKLLKWFAGGDVVGFLRDVVPVDDMPRVAKEVYSAIERLAPVQRSCKPKERHHMVAAFKLSAGPFLTHRTLTDRGWLVGSKLWAYCTEGGERDRGGRPSIPSDIADAVVAHCEAVSQPVNRRTIKKRKTADDDDGARATDCVVRRMDCNNLGLP